ncbi:CBS domain-containing protein [Nevskia sp.]|uniref:CBS domain-containing protein n=1 Tax=Nevskia sp. TaxID=1929292 RepID=UPI0025F7EB67|nr:CBS domain-containing protein [Nevskia sp.]HET7797046.1 CBS domain-containing protein [Nevskia sp.]
MATLDSVKVREYMTTKLVTFTPDMEVMQAVHTLVEKGISGAPVLDAKGNLVGMLSQRDCLDIALVAAQDSCIAGPVAQFMSSSPVTVDPDTNLTQLATMFTTAPFRRYPVIENGKLVGQISRSDVLRAISRMC